MVGHEIERKSGLVVAVEVGPVHGNDDLLARADQMRHPAGEAVPDIDALVAEQSVDLLDRMLGHEAACLRQCLPDHRHRQRRTGHDAKGGRGQ